MWIKLIITALTLTYSQGLTFTVKEDCGLKSSGIYISISRDGQAYNDQVTRYIQLYWYGMNVTNDSWTAIWASDPRLMNALELKNKSLQYHGVYNSYGKIIFNIKWNGNLIPHQHLPHEECLPYWGAYMSGDDIKEVSCLKLQHNWMFQMKDKLKYRMLENIALPGSHENGITGNMGHSVYHNSTNKWSIVGGSSMWSQLLFGARYFEFGITLHNDSYSVLHGKFAVAPLAQVLNDLNSFLRKTKELIVIKISHLGSEITKNETQFMKFKNLLIDKLSPWLIEKKEKNLKITYLWNTDQRLMISLPAPSAEFRNNSGDPPLTNLNEFLHSLTQSKVSSRGRIIRVAQEYLRHFYENDDKDLNIRRKKNNSLSKIIDLTKYENNEDQPMEFPNEKTKNGSSDNTTTKVTEVLGVIDPLYLRLNRQWCPLINVLSADFFISTDIVDIAREINDRFVLTKQKTPKGPCDTINDVIVWPSLKAAPDVTFYDQSEYRLVQVNWKVKEVLPDDWVGIFRTDPSTKYFNFKQKKLNSVPRKKKILTEPSRTLSNSSIASRNGQKTLQNRNTRKKKKPMQRTNKQQGNIKTRRSIKRRIKRQISIAVKKKHQINVPQTVLQNNFTSTTAKTKIQFNESYINTTELPRLYNISNIKNNSSNNQTKAIPVPRKKPSDVLFKARPYASNGQLTSTVSHPRPSISEIAQGGCLGVYAAYMREGRALKTQCIGSHPSWLWDNREILKNVPLAELVLPGTHNSGSYSLNDSYDAVATWVACQDEDVLSQLLHGYRYLDLRVGYYPETPELMWINHDIVQWRPLRSVLDQIIAFVTLSPDPVIVDIHRTPVGFDDSPEAVTLLVSLLNSTLGSFALPSHYTSQVSLDQIWSLGKPLIVSYGDPKTRTGNPMLWPPIRQEWADAQTLNNLRKFIDQKMKEMGRISPKWRPIWAAMGHLTPTIWDILLGTGSGVRGMADRSGRDVTTWLRERWALNANVLTTDFFHTSDLVQTSIEINKMRQKCPIKLKQSRHVKKKEGS